MTKRLFTILLIFFCTTGLFAQLNILPLGNSITLGNYRYDLWQMLIDEGIDFEFVGTVNSKPTSGGQMNAWPPYQNHIFNDSHEGHSGWKSYEILNGSPSNPDAGNIYTWLLNYTPDLVLLHIGTNDVTHLTASESAEHISQIIRALQANNPNVVVFLAKIIPRENFYNEVTALNIYMETVAENTRTATSCIHIVDQFSDFDLWADTYDGTHPDRSGDVKMAQKWTTAITAHLNNESGDCNETTPMNCTSLNTNSTVFPTTCGLDNGTATVHISGGHAPYSVYWSNESNETTLINLAAGMYEVMVADANECVIVETIEIEDSKEMQLNVDETSISCFGREDGRINLTILEGTAPFRYNWSNGLEVEDIQNLTAGTYTVEVKDALDCQVTTIVNIDMPDELEASIYLTAATNNEGGTAKVEMTGGTPDYRFFWSQGAMEAEVTNLSAGIYEVSIADANNCILVETLEIEYITNVLTALKPEYWNIYPNPTSDFLNIKIELATIQPFQLNLYNALSERLYTHNYKEQDVEIQLNMQDLIDGVYFLEIKTKKDQHVKKVLVHN